MRKITPYIIFFLAGLIVLGFLFHNEIESFISVENDFRISDTLAVSRIEILSEDTIILTRKGASWLVNNDAPASQVAVDNLLFSFNRMSVKGINNKPDITKGKGLKIRIFAGRKKHLLRFYEIDRVAFMHKEGAGKFYAVEVNGFPDIKPGKVITSDPDYWKDRTLLNIHPEEIREISLLHPEDPENDFIIKVSDSKPVLFDGSGVEVPENSTDKEKLNFYLSYFTNVFYDYTENSEVLSDSAARWILKVEDNTGKKYELKVCPVKTSTGDDMFKAFVKYNNQPGFKVTRYMVLDLLLQDRGHFLMKDFKD